MADPKASKVPKFASFRPKPVPSAPVPEVPKTRRSGHQGDDSDERKRHHRRHHRSRSREKRHPSPPNPIRAHVEPKDQVQEAAPVYIIDRKGDVKNLVYGCIHRYDVPPFHRFGAGCVLGARSNLKIDRGHSEDKGIILLDWRHSKVKSREKYVFSRLEKQKPRLLKIRPETKDSNSTSVETDFIPLKSQHGRKRKRSDAVSQEGSDQDEKDYRSIHGKAKADNKQPLDEDLEWATESDSSGSDSGRVMKIDAGIRKRNVELSQKVETSPHDIEAWLALIDHQDVMIKAGDDRHHITNAELRSTADIKIHMYEKALSHISLLGDRERLLLGMMNEGSKFWEVQTQSDKWEQISKDNIDSIRLWTSYLNFKQTTFSTFRYEDVRDVLVARLKLLLEVVSSQSDPAKVQDLFDQIIYVLLRLTTLIRESGYSELAISIWQGLLEINFLAPAKQLTKVDTRKLFGEFWESEVPRVGENGALGWRAFFEDPDKFDIPETLVDPPEDHLGTTDIFRDWAKAERSKSKLCNPARTMDEVAEDDPFRVILFSDIEQLLIQLPSNSVPLRKSLINAFLIFCRQPQIVTPENPESSSLLDASVRDELLEGDPEWIKHEYLVSSIVDDTIPADALETAAKHYPTSVETMFGSSLWHRFHIWKDIYSEHGGPVSYEWVRNSIRLLVQGSFDEDLAEYYLAFLFRNEPETIKKTAKGLLKQHPSSVRLYNAYAMIEWSRGNRDIAKGVFTAALSMSNSGISTSSNIRSNSLVSLWKNWIWLCLQDGDNLSALQHLLAAVGGSPDSSITSSPTILLKAKQHFCTNRDFHLSSGNSVQATSYAECLALLEYLTSETAKESKSAIQGNISSAMESYESFSQTLVNRGFGQSSTHELFLQSASYLLHHHARMGSYRPALLQEQLTRFLQLFPRNTIFLSLYEWNESRVRIDNRVRNILLSSILAPENDCITSRLFAIRYEIKHGTIHSARSAFEHAVTSTACKPSAGMWKFYILYCQQTLQFQAKAKEVWYRALRACPWAKELYLVGFDELRDSVGFTELKRTWRVIGEKDLRVHVDLEDKFEEIEELEKKGRKVRKLGNP